MLCHVLLCCVLLCYVMCCYVMCCYVMCCYVMYCFVMSCVVMLCVAETRSISGGRGQVFNNKIIALITLSLIKTLSDASAADDFLKQWRQKKKLLNLTSNFSLCHHVFNSIKVLYFHIKGVSISFWYVFKVACCRVVVFGKGIMAISRYDKRSLIAVQNMPSQVRLFFFDPFPRQTC